MTNHTLSNVKDKIIGSAKSTLGNATNNEKMKTKGDHQYVQAVEQDETRKHQGPHDSSLGHLHDNKDLHGDKGHLHDNQGGIYGSQGTAKDDSRVHKAEAFGERIEGNVKHATGQAVGSDKLKQSGERDRLHGQHKYEDNVVGVEGHKQQHAQNTQSQFAAQGLAQDAHNQYPESGPVQDARNQYPASGPVQDSQIQYPAQGTVQDSQNQPAQQQNPGQQQYPGQHSSF
ncbi:hypothetical protein GGH96_002529 [Coemansia sp. RSA 1972]|nr:hypothetical protein GGH96_002529 [Coemansia sp. RSA 1972]